MENILSERSNIIKMQCFPRFLLCGKIDSCYCQSICMCNRFETEMSLLFHSIKFLLEILAYVKGKLLKGDRGG